MKKKWVVGVYFVLMSALMSGCGNKDSDSKKEEAVTESVQSTEQGKEDESTTEEVRDSKPLSADFEVKVQPDQEPREVTRYVYANGKKWPLVEGAIAEDCLSGHYRCSDIDNVSLPLDAKVRDQFSYSTVIAGNNLSDIPVDVWFGRGFEYGTPYSSINDFTIVKSESLEKSYQRDWIIEKYGDVDGDVIYHNYEIQRHIYTARIVFANSENDMIGYHAEDQLLCQYTIDDDTIHLRGIDVHEDYSFEYTDFQMDLKYSFNGLNLVLGRDNVSVDFMTEDAYYTKFFEKNYYSLNAAPKNKKQILEGIIYFCYRKLESGEISQELYFSDGMMAVDPELNFQKDGTFSIKWTQVTEKKSSKDKITLDRGGEIKGSFIGDATDEGAILLVDNKAYAYMMPGSWEDYNTLIVDGLVLDKDISEISDDEMASIMEKQENAAGRINDALANNADAVVDLKSGEVIYDSGVLFAYDSADLGEDGKKLLDSFLADYGPVISELTGEGVIKGVMITGYTDSQGTYEYNKELSEKRAENVMNYMLEKYPDLKDALQFEGRASENLIYNDDGTVNDDASRRVVFDLIIESK